MCAERSDRSAARNTFPAAPRRPPGVARGRRALPARPRRRSAARAPLAWSRLPADFRARRRGAGALAAARADGRSRRRHANLSARAGAAAAATRRGAGVCSPARCGRRSPAAESSPAQAMTRARVPGQADLERIAGPVTTLTKNKCRVFWSAPLDGPYEAALVERMAAAGCRATDCARAGSSAGPACSPGIGSTSPLQLLAAHCRRISPVAPPTSALASATCPSSCSQRCAGIAALDVYEAERRALDLARRNLAAFEQRATIRYCWHDVTAGLTRHATMRSSAIRRFTRTRAPIVRTSVAASSRAAAQALRPGGRLWLVANRHLPYEQALGAGFERVRIVTQQHGFKIVEAVKAKRA